MKKKSQTVFCLAKIPKGFFKGLECIQPKGHEGPHRVGAGFTWTEEGYKTKAAG